MKPEIFEKMLIEAELHPHRLGQHHGVAFGVSLHVPKEIAMLDGDIVRSMRVQCEFLIYQPAEFAMMTIEQAKRQIELCITRLERAAQTQQGNLCEQEKPKAIVRKVAPSQRDVKYPAH